MRLFKMANILIKNLLRRPATISYPFGQRLYPKNSRGKISIDIEECVFCGICRNKCPTAAISVDRQAKTWQIDRLRCIACGYCVELCPKKCLSMESHYSGSMTVRSKESYQDARVPHNGENS